MTNDELLKPRDSMNPFTEALKEKIQQTGEPVLVKLRDGSWREIVFREIAFGLEKECFTNPEWSMVWMLNGESITSQDFDMVMF